MDERSFRPRQTQRPFYRERARQWQNPRQTWLGQSRYCGTRSDRLVRGRRFLRPWTIEYDGSRRDVTRATLHRLRKAYQSLFFGDGVFGDRVDRVAGEFADDPLVQNIVAFVRAGGKRPLMRPNVKRGVEDKEGDAS
jgi:Udp N-acetylglucosamine O-acyltransferase